MPSVSSPGNVQPTSWLKNLAKSGQASQFLAQRPVESDVQATDRPRPYCHWARSGSWRAVTSTAGRRLGGRPVVAEELREPLVEPRAGSASPRLDREERLLDDLLAGDLLGLLQEDVGDARRVASPRRSAHHRPSRGSRGTGSTAARTDRREGDARGLHPGQDRPSYWPDVDQPSVSRMMSRLVAVARRVTHRLVEAGEDIRLAVGRIPANWPWRSLDLAERLGPADPVCRLVERDDAEFVVLGSAAAARRIASLPMSTLRTPPMPVPPRRRCRTCCSGTRPWSRTGR